MKTVNFFRKAAAALTIAAVVFTGCKKDDAVKVTSVKLNQNDLTLNIGGTMKLTAEVLPDNAADKTVEWKSNDDKIATVDQTGNVTAVTVGETTVTATANDGSGVRGECKITVKKPELVKVTKITLNKPAISLEVGGVDKIEFTVEPTEATDKTVTWRSDKPNIASVDAEGNVKAVAVGEATVTASANDGSGVKGECKVTVREVDPGKIKVTKITLNKTVLELEAGTAEKLTAAIEPTDATDKTVTWSNDKPDIATVDSEGNVKAVAVGEAIITVRANDGSGVTGQCKVTVTPGPVKVTKITLNKPVIWLVAGTEETLTIDVEPAEATNKTVTWSSDKSAVATVDTGGKVKAIAVGEAIITATANDGSGVKGECKVVVRKPGPSMTVSTGRKGATTISLAGIGTATIDWGEGGEPQTVTLPSDGTLVKNVYTYSKTSPFRDIVIEGDNVLEMYCDNAQADRLDVSKNPGLKLLGCLGNALTTIDLTKNAVLEELDCRFNQLTSIDLSKNTALKVFRCSRMGKVTKLDLSKNTSLTKLICSFNQQLLTLDLSKNPNLAWVDCRNCNMVKLNVGNNPKIEYLCCAYNQLEELDLSSCVGLTELESNDTNLKHLDLSNNAALWGLYVGHCKLTSIDMTNNPKMKRLSLFENEISQINLSTLTKLEFFDCAKNKLSNLDMSHNPELNAFECGYNQLTSLNMSNNQKLLVMACQKNQFTAEDLNALFGTLHGNDIPDNPTKKIFIGGNPGTDTCDKSIADSKGWTVDTEPPYEPEE